jgi:uncharacterized protein (DUF924 family)
MATQAEVIEFWCGDLGSDAASYANRRKLWFRKDADTDRTIRDRFLPLYEQALSGALDDWQQSPQGCLALLILLDQFSRNLFRGSAQSFAADAKARAIAQAAIAQGFDQQLAPIQRIFLYLPLEHSENPADQQQSVALFQTLSDVDPQLADLYDYALRHKAVIDRFGRFPHRNQSLGRESRLEELEFLQQPGSAF